MTAWDLCVPSPAGFQLRVEFRVSGWDSENDMEFGSLNDLDAVNYPLVTDLYSWGRSWW